MNLPFSLKQKLRIATFFFIIMVCTLLIRMLEDKSWKAMDSAFASMYKDRLVPATDLFQVAEHLHLKQQLIYEHAKKSVSSIAVTEQMAVHNDAIAKLLNKYSQTFLIEKEKLGLSNIHRNMLKIKTMESNLWKAQGDAGSQLSLDLLHLHQTVSRDVANLTGIQSKVGEELSRDTQKIVWESRLYATLQLVLAIIIGLLIVAILFTTKAFTPNTKSFSLN